MYVERNKQKERSKSVGNFSHNGWCHGAAGIILSRAECLSQDTFARDILSNHRPCKLPKAAVHAVLDACKMTRNDSLCCGVSGCGGWMSHNVVRCKTVSCPEWRVMVSRFPSTT